MVSLRATVLCVPVPTMLLNSAMHVWQVASTLTGSCAAASVHQVCASVCGVFQQGRSGCKACAQQLNTVFKPVMDTFVFTCSAMPLTRVKAAV
jgi:hypothetical protein